MSERPFQGSAVITPGGLLAAQTRAVGVNCTVVGNVSLLLNDGSSLVIPVPVGWSELFYKIRTVNISGTTATATYSALY